MERDFLGLGSKNVPVTAKEEISDGSKDSVPMRGSGMQWSFSNKVSAIPQLLSFKTASPEEKPRKVVHDPMASSGFISISTADAFDFNQKPYSAMLQKRAGNNHAMTTYGMQHIDSNPNHCPKEIRVFPVLNQQSQTITDAMNAPVLQSHLVSAGHSVASNSPSSQPFGRVPIITSVSALPTTSSIIGTTDLRNSSTPSAAPTQLTIFYAGSVCVYDDISPEKAQAIMLLAGNGTAANHSRMLSTAQAQVPTLRPSAGDGYVGGKTHATSPSSGIPSPISVTSSSNYELALVKQGGDLASSANQTEPSKPVTLVGSSSVTIIPSVAVPQARKASLARFLEKRKERVTSVSPYNVSKKSLESSAAGSDGGNLTIKSSLPSI